jgi:hypothetical protein
MTTPANAMSSARIVGTGKRIVLDADHPGPCFECEHRLHCRATRDACDLERQYLLSGGFRIDACQTPDALISREHSIASERLRRKRRDLLDERRLTYDDFNASVIAQCQTELDSIRMDRERMHSLDSFVGQLLESIADQPTGWEFS